MPSTITATLERSVYGNQDFIIFYITSPTGANFDFITIERKTKGKHRDKACWSANTHYKAYPIDSWLEKLQNYGFDISEFAEACIELGWEKEVKEWQEERHTINP